MRRFKRLCGWRLGRAFWWLLGRTERMV